MYRRFIWALGALMLVSVLLPAQRALACSLVMPAPAIFVDQAEVIAVGTLSNPTSDAITLKVDEYLKGSAAAPELLVNNHSFDIDASCEESLGPGSRLPDGARVLAFLEPDEHLRGVNWRPAGIGGTAIFVVDGEGLHHVSMQSPEPLGTLAEAKALIADQTGEAPRTPDPDATDGSPAGSGSPVATQEGWSLPQILLVVLLLTTMALVVWFVAQFLRSKAQS